MLFHLTKVKNVYLWPVAKPDYPKTIMEFAAKFHNCVGMTVKASKTILSATK